MTRSSLIVGIVVLTAVAAGALLWHQRPAAPQPAPSSSPSLSFVPEIASRTTAGHRVIFVGLDGADWSLLDQYIARGVMPTLNGLVKDGTSGVLTTIHPPLSPLVWTTMLTGVSPLEHRILDFLRVHPTSHQREPITSDERKAPAIWNMATMAGKRVGAFGFWATYPAEPVNGVMVSDRLFTFLYGETSPPPGIVSPATLEPWARAGLKGAEAGIDYAELKRFLPWLSESDYGAASGTVDPYAHPVSALRRILVETRVYEALSRDWIARERPDVAVVYIQGTDSIGHVFAPFAPPRQPTITPADFDKYSDVAERYFADLDRMLDRYRRLAESTDSVLMLASDHGFRWGEGRPATMSSVAKATAAEWHTDRGMYVIWGRGVSPTNGHDQTGSIQQVCATILALAGLPGGKDVMGPPLQGAPPPDGTPVDYGAHYSPAPTASTSAASTPQRVDEETIAKLRALGYIGASDTAGGAAGTRTAGSFNNEGVLLKQLGKHKEAIDAFDRALSVDPKLASAAWNLSDLLWARNESIDKSDALLVRAFGNGLPHGTQYLIGRAIGYQRDGKLDRAVALLNQAIGVKPDDPEVWLFRGRYRVEQGACRAALADFQQATSLAPSNAAAFAAQGLAQACAGDHAGARESFRRSLALDPNQPKVREYLRQGKP